MFCGMWEEVYLASFNFSVFFLKFSLKKVKNKVQMLFRFYPGMAELAKSEFKTLAKTENILLICFYSI
jgi:hypothetical protein